MKSENFGEKCTSGPDDFGRYREFSRLDSGVVNNVKTLRVAHSYV